MHEPSNPPPASPVPVCPTTADTYTVQRGDTLGAIARNVLGDAHRWRDIATLNRDLLPNPDRLEVGQVLALPSAAPRASPAIRPLEGLYWGDSFGSRVALTFDDGPHPENTPRVLDLLAQAGARATFFVCGCNVRRHPALVRRIVDAGHTLGNHSDTHANLAKLTAEEVERELAGAQAAVDEALGCHHELHQVRPPYGSMGGEVKQVLQALGHAAVLWNVDSNDWRYPNNEARILANVFSADESVHARGGVILFHDIHPQTGRVLGELLARLQREGFEVVQTSALLRQKYPETRPPVA